VASTTRAFVALVAAQARAQAQYRTSFLVDVLANFMFGVLDIATIFVVYGVAQSLGGFPFAETFLMAGLATLGFALADLLVGSIERIRVYVRTGLLDTVLVRPLGALGQLVALDFAPRRIGRVVVALVVLAVAFGRVDVDWTPARVALLLVTPVAGAVVFGSIFVLTAVVAFWWIESGEFANAFTYGGREFATYPFNIYAAGFRYLFGFGLGYAFVGYYPGLALLGREDPLGLPTAAGWLSPLAALVTFALATLAWRSGIRHYRSTGS
jgi:ABC-2 type transport system permease protein